MRSERRRAARWVATALAILVATLTPALASTTDTFSSPDLSAFTEGGAPGWFVEGEHLGHSYTPSTGEVELVRIADWPSVEADVTLSPGRSSAGLTVLWKDHDNHLWAKLEVSPGHPSGLMSIGRRLEGAVTSLLAVAKGGLVAGGTYHVVLQVADGLATFTATELDGSFSRTLTYRLTADDLTAFGSGSYAGLRGKYLFDEDDGGSRWDNLIVG